MPPTTLILVRHAETEANINAVWHGALDSPLTPRGQLQVAATGARFAILAPALGGIDAFYVSPLQRAQTTAAAIGAAIGMTPAIDDELSEFDLGDWEGRAMDELAAAEDLWGIWAVDANFAPPNGESPASFGMRALRSDASPGAQPRGRDNPACYPWWLHLQCAGAVAWHGARRLAKLGAAQLRHRHLARQW